MLKKLFSRLSKRGKQYDTIANPGTLSVSESDDNGLVFNVNVDGFTEKEKEELYSTALDKTEHTSFEGHVEHAYAIHRVERTDRCPRCHARTLRQYGNFIYATQIAPRVMFAPAGFFCTECPSVIIDEDMIKGGIMDRKCKYQGVLGLDYKGQKELDLFKTWNGKAAVYIMDENQMPIGLSTLDAGHPHTPQLPAGNRQRKKKNRRKIAKTSRRMNRKK